MSNPVAYRWTGTAMVPLNSFFAARATKQYEVGKAYVLVPNEARSPESHKFYFAMLHEAWLNLAEEYADRYPSSEHLRAYALTKAGYADKNTIVCATTEDAIRTAAIASTREKIRIIEISGKVVTVWIPRSQNMRSMGKAEFERSKNDVLDVVSAMTHSSRHELEKNAGKSA